MNDERFMQRCLELASNGLGHVAPNPMVGCVIVHENKIIGEGYHQKFGEAHAEVNAIRHVERKYGNEVLGKSTLYVSLEPCNHHGKTPPCSDLILEKKIKKIVVGCRDSSAEVNGKGIERLKNAGCDVNVGTLEKECFDLNKRFFTFHEKKRPYIILKYAQSKDGFIGHGVQNGNARVLISNDLSRKLVHKWRSEEQAIMVGTNTAATDNPYLTVRDWKGNNPIRIVLDRMLKLSSQLNVFDSSAITLLFNEMISESRNRIELIKVEFGKDLIKEILNYLWKRNIQSVIVEGGAKLLQSFIDSDLWDEARIFTGNKLLGEGIKVPQIHDYKIISEEDISDDRLTIIKHF